MKKDDNIKKTIDMLVAVGAAGAAAVIGAGHIIDKFGKKNQVQKDPLLLLPPDAKPYVDRFTQTFFFDEFIGSKRIRDVVIKLIEVQEYDSAVREACFVFFAVIREKSGVNDEDGMDLIDTVFNSKKPVLKFSKLAPDPVKDLSKDMHFLFKNIVSLFRNSAMHAQLDLSKHTALQQIGLISYATEIVENNTFRVI